MYLLLQQNALFKLKNSLCELEKFCLVATPPLPHPLPRNCLRRITVLICICFIQNVLEKKKFRCKTQSSLRHQRWLRSLFKNTIFPGNRESHVSEGSTFYLKRDKMTDHLLQTVGISHHEVKVCIIVHGSADTTVVVKKLLLGDLSQQREKSETRLVWLQKQANLFIR